MTRTRAGLLLGLGLAVGLAAGVAGSSLAASPTPGPTNGQTTPWTQTMGGWGAGMMGNWGGDGSTPSTGFGPGMMGDLGSSGWSTIEQACDAMHDAIFGSDADSATPSAAPNTR